MLLIPQSLLLIYCCVLTAACGGVRARINICIASICIVFILTRTRYIIYQHLHNTIAGTVGWVTERTHALGDERRINAVSISYSLVLIVWVHKKMESSPSLSLSSCLILGWGDGLRICTSTCSRCVRTAVAFKVADLGDYRLTDIRVCTSMPSNRSTRPDLQL